MNCGAAIPEGITLPEGLPELFDDDETPPPTAERGEGWVTLHFHHVGRFRIALAERTITAFDIAPGTAECVIEHVINDHIAPRLLAELGELVLHASAVRFGERIVLFLGETGAGKSTLATSLHQAGHHLLGDDAVIVTRGSGGYCAQAVYPSLRLFPEAIERLIGSGASTTPMADYSDKQHVRLATLPPVAQPPLPLAAIFFLAGKTASASPATSVCARPLPSTMACIKLVEQSFTLDPHDPACAARRLASLSALALALPAFTLSYPHDFACLGEVHAVIAAILQKAAPEVSTGHQEKLPQ
ncbi:MAG: hypothetical protein ACK4IC_07515 [Erythrobacter sp.]